MSTGCPCCCCCCRPRVRTPPSSALSTPCTSHPSISAATWKAFSGAPVSSEDSAPDPERLVLPMTLVYFFFRRGGPCAWMHGARTDRHPPRTAAPPAHCSSYATIGILPPVNGTMKNLRRGPTHRCGASGTTGPLTGPFFLLLPEYLRHRIIEHLTHHDREDVHRQALGPCEVRLGCPYPPISRLPRRARSCPLCT